MTAESAVSPGARVYDVAVELGLPLAQSCGGEGICGRCAVRVVCGAESLSVECASETHRKEANRVDPELRLACLSFIHGPVVLTTDYW
jgi:2Fe-2S ferredoxin